LIEIGLLVLEKKIFFDINICKYSFSLLWPLPTPRDHDVNNSESTLYQKLSCKYDLFWLIGSEEDF
jgi:hypothetical protein